MNIKIKLIILYACTLIIMLALSFTLFLNISSLNKNTVKINEAQGIISDAEQLVLSMIEQEAALRGYLATSNQEYKVAFNNATLEFDTRMSNLEETVADDESQTKKLEDIKLQSDKWHAEAADKYLMIQKEIIESNKIVTELNELIASKADKTKMDLAVAQAKKIVDIELRDEILYSLASMQTGMRGYLLTGDESFLEPYVEGREETLISLNRIGDEELTEVSKDWMNNVAFSQIDLKQKSMSYKSEDDLFAEMEKDIGKTTMEEIVAKTSVFKAYENMMLEELSDEAENKTKTSTIYILLAIVLSLIAGVFVMGSLNKISTTLVSFIETISTGSKQVSVTSDQFASAGHQLSEGATEQAASIEETSATMDETSSMVRQNAQNTKQANELSENASQAAVQGSVKVKEMNESMDELKASSLEISKIIKVIDDIAFQTNMLALNAAVEAARAGDAGLGFAVVAQEVRNLAQKSADAAKNTSAIIDRNIELSEQGVVMSDEVSDALKVIITKIEDVNQLMSEITVASDEQSKGIEQITTAIGQMEKVVQSNVNTAEQSATSANEMQTQATSLEKAVKELNKLVNGDSEGFKFESKLFKKLVSKKTRDTNATAENISEEVAEAIVFEGEEQDKDKMLDEIIPLNSSDEF